MSANFTGVTFPNQKVTPAHDAVVRRAVLADGILTGCEFSYSGYTLTMTAGQLIICGRQIIHPSSQNWVVSGATSGVARLLLTIDVTRTSTKDTFDQVLDQIQYATDVNGFPALDQTDINASGTRYQVAACVVSLGPGGITGIVNKLDEAEGGGAGGVLTVKTAPGATVTVSKGDKVKTKSADSNGIATFRGLKRGEWDATVRKESETNSQKVAIETDYTIELPLFKSVIHIVYPAGLTCTITDGEISRTAPDTSGVWECVVPKTGIWTITAGEWSGEAVIATPGQTETVRLARWIVKDGVPDIGLSTQLVSGRIPEVEQGDGYMTIKVAQSQSSGIMSDDRINMNKASTVIADVDIVKLEISANAKFKGVILALTTSTEYSSVDNAQKAIDSSSASTTTGHQEISVDVTNVENDWYVGFALGSVVTLNLYSLRVEV